MPLPPKSWGRGSGPSHIVVGYDLPMARGEPARPRGFHDGAAQGFGVDVVAPVGAEGATFSSSGIQG